MEEPIRLEVTQSLLIVVVALGGGSSMLATMLRAVFPELEKIPRLKSLLPYFPAILSALLATAIPSTLPGVGVEIRWLLGLLIALLWYPIYARVKAGIDSAQIQVTPAPAASKPKGEER